MTGPLGHPDDGVWMSDLPVLPPGGGQAPRGFMATYLSDESFPGHMMNNLP